jgi:pimeloyl-ACP methyl ester carboxylesterase
VDIKSKYISVDNIRTHFLEAGQGRPVVLLHSGEFGGCAEISWEFVIPKLAERYRVIAPDWLGFGRTDKVHDFVEPQARRLAHLRCFLHVMDLETADVVGNSMGGSAFARALAAEPSAYAIRSLTLISSGGFAPDNEHRRVLLAYDCTREAMRAQIGAMFHDPRWAADEAYVERRHQLSLLPGAWECTAAVRFKNPAAGQRERFGQPDNTPYEKIAVPVLIIAGANDKLRLPGYAQELAAKFRAAELHVLDACGHCPNIERAADVNGILLAFLGRLDKTAPSHAVVPEKTGVTS